MGWAERRDGYFRARYRCAGRLEVVKDEHGRVARFRSKREAERAANDAESQALRALSTSRTDAAAKGRVLFGDYARNWYAVQDLARSTMQNYRRHLEEPLLPAFESWALADITALAVAAWRSTNGRCRTRRPASRRGARHCI